MHVVIVLVIAAPACSDRASTGDPIDLAMREEQAERARAGRSVPYRTVQPARWGRVQGIVGVRGEARRDTVVLVHDEPRTCGERVTLPLVRGQRDRLADAVVWIDGIREGKPLALERRFEVLYNRCRLAPVVQSAVVGGMMMVRSADPIEHRTRMTRVASGEVIGVVRQGDSGSLVPVPEVLEIPALVEFRSEPRPWSRAWVRVFDHPYHMITRNDGAFVFDSVPSGRQRVIAWHPRYGRLATDIELAAGETAEVELFFDADEMRAAAPTRR